ncbi:MAG: ABC transporter substrate-binding protein [Thermomicrobiales bacterium]
MTFDRRSPRLLDKMTRAPLTRRQFLGTAGLGAAVAATGPHGQTTAAPALLQEEQTLRIAFVGTQVSPTDESVAEGFKSVVPEANVEFIPIQGTDWNEYFAKVLTMIASGTVPDLMTVATEGTQLFAGQGLAAPLDEFVQRDQAAMQEYFADVHPSLVEAMMYEGSLYELPFDWNAANLFINTKLLEERGHEYPAADWDKETFYQIAKDLTKEDGGPPFGYGWVNRLWGGWMPWIFVNGGNLLTEARAPGGEWLWDSFYVDNPAAEGRGGGWRWEAPQANTPANVEALEFMVQLAQEGITPSVEAGGGGLLQGFFTSDSLGMTPAGGFWAGGLTEAGMEPGAFDVQFFPTWTSQRHQFGTAGLIMFAESEVKDLAWEYMKYYVSTSTMESVFQGNFSTPARRSMMTAERYAPTGPEHWQVFYDTLDKHPDTAPIPAPPQSNEMTTIFMKYTSLAATFEQSPQEALDNMQKDLEELFASES